MAIIAVIGTGVAVFVGTDVGVLVDILGGIRPQGSNPDIGPFEFGSTGIKQGMKPTLNHNGILFANPSALPVNVTISQPFDKFTRLVLLTTSGEILAESFVGRQGHNRNSDIVLHADHPYSGPGIIQLQNRTTLSLNAITIVE